MFNRCCLSLKEHCQVDSDDHVQARILYLAAAIVLARFCSASALVFTLPLRSGIFLSNASNQCLVNNVKFVDRHCFGSYDQQWHKQVRKDQD